MFKKTLIAAFVSATALSLAACGGSSDSSSDSPETPTNMTVPQKTTDSGTTLKLGNEVNITYGAFTAAELTDVAAVAATSDTDAIPAHKTLNGDAWTAGWTVNVHGNADAWTKPTGAVADDSCPTGTSLKLDTVEGMDICELPATISSDVTLTNDNVYYVANGGTRVGTGNEETPVDANQGHTLTINAGTLVLAGTGDYLLITRGNKINAVGTADAPINFRSKSWADGTGAESRGSWGGVVLQGKGVDFKGTNVQGEGGVEYYAGSDNTDNSGEMKYVVITGAGYDIDGNGNELNALTLQGVGSATELSYIQLDMTQDDGIEFFGGAASVNNLVLTDIGDDAFDADNGWKGAANNVFIHMSSSFSAGGAGESRGIEADGYDPKTTAGLKYIDPTKDGQTTVMDLDKFTIVGNSVSDTGMVLRRGVQGTFTDFNVSGFVSDAGIEIRDRGTLESGTVTDTANGTMTYTGSYDRLVIENSQFYGNSTTVKISAPKDNQVTANDFASSTAKDNALASWKAAQLTKGTNGVNFGD